MNMKTTMALVLAVVGLNALAVQDVSSIDGLKAAIDAVNNGTSSDTTIRLAAGTYILSSEMTPMTSNSNAFFEIKKSMTIEGSDTTSWRNSGEKVTGTVIDAGTYSGSIFKITPTSSSDHDNVKDTVFRHLTLQNASSTLAGGAISLTHSKTVTEVVTNCVFKSNTTSSQAGATSHLNLLDCYFKGNTSTSDGGAARAASKVENCLFDGNKTTGGSANGGALRDCATIKGCVFKSNHSTYAGVAFGKNYTFENCTCITNTSNRRGCVALEYDSNVDRWLTIRGCHFEGNSSDGSIANESVGACWRATLVTNCVFAGNKSLYRNGGSLGLCRNVVDCAFTNNTAGSGYSGSAVFRCTTVRNCDFYGNSLSQQYAVDKVFLGGDCYGATLVTNCTFRNDSFDARNGAYVNTNVVDCTFVNSGAIGNVAVVRCGFFDHQNQVDETDKDKVRNVILGGVFTNCLVTGCCENYIVGENTELVNCTIVSNNQTSGNGQLFGGMVTAVNTIFKDNYKVDGISYDVAGKGDWHFTNSIYKSHPNWTSTYTFHDTDCIYDTAKLFEDSTRPKYDTAHPYKLRTNSPAVNAGLAIPGMAALTDYSGAGRVNGDRIDIGCYECWLKPLGFMLVFR